MNVSLQKWYKVALINLFVLTLLGLVLRYKINFSLPFIEQKNLLHAHSHFAFNGWISFLLQVLILDFFTNNYTLKEKFWNRFFIASTIINYAMIFSFAWQGYGALSIVFSTLALFISYVFVYGIVQSLPTENKNKISVWFIKASLFFLVLSSLGPYLLAYIIANKNEHQYPYHNALYFFLHFQYNGWFLFAVMGFLIKKLELQDNYNIANAKRFFVLLFITCVPSYMLTVLWHHTPTAVTVFNILTVAIEAVALYYGFQLLHKNYKNTFKHLPIICRYFYSFAIAAFVLKVILQIFSSHPQLGQLAFSFRPIIIGYLHLIFLVFVSLYLLGLLAEKNIIPLESFTSKLGLIIFSSGVIFNELLLAIQGVGSIFYWYLPVTNLILFYNTITMVVGSFLIYKSLGQTYLSSIKNKPYAEFRGA